MKLYDLSPEINEEMAVYRDKPENKPRVRVVATIKKGGIANESRFDLYAHTGSHVDAPLHFLDDGVAIDRLGLDRFMGKAVVLDFTKVKNAITKNILRNSKIKIQKNDIVLLKTRNNPIKTYDYKFVFLEKSGAKYLASKKVKAVGLDSLSIERDQHDYSTHKILLKNNMPIFEGLDLSKVKQGNYLFYGFPLKIKAEGSPVRAVLVKE
ncbi:cyclase family protein [Candidatus Woesearchaeota archaeon]|nr:cyclase family protein [Candidatus Woesearchaeota archaeon]